MSFRYRSRNNSIQIKSNQSKSLIKGSMQTKQQSTCRNSPKLIKNTKMKINKKSKNNLNQQSIKGIQQLHLIIGKLHDKLESFQDQSLNISIKSENQQQGNQISNIHENVINKNEIQQSLTTSVVCQQLKSAKKQFNQPTPQPNHQLPSPPTFLQNYNRLFNTALGKLTFKTNLTILKTPPQQNPSQPTPLQQQQIRQFKKKQNKNWKSLNQQLFNFISNNLNPTTNKYHQQYLISQLHQQAKINYRWFQIQEKMSKQNLQLIEKINQQPYYQRRNNYRKIDQKNIQNNFCKYHGQQQPICIQLCTTTNNDNKPIVQYKNFHKLHDLTPDMHITSNKNQQQYISNCQQIAELIVNYLLLEFTSDLAYKLDHNSLIKFHQQYQDTSLTDQTSPQNYPNLFKTITQIAQDCLLIDSPTSSTTNPNKQISFILTQALMELLEANPSLSHQQSKQQLKYMITHRDIDIKEIITDADVDQYQLARISVIVSISQIIFGMLVMEQLGQFITG